MLLYTIELRDMKNETNFDGFKINCASYVKTRYGLQ
jgi:hypothetical protein